ncbi:MAG: hypothetical protein EAX96_08880 [Candidatus Lokiarchaeota archaeon]|nr:hypothetical protein [Candidatus Lokiarchaeota archaeon]
MKCEDCGKRIYFYEEFCEECKTFHTEEYMIACFIKASACEYFKWKPRILQVELNRHCQSCKFYKNHSCTVQK